MHIGKVRGSRTVQLPDGGYLSRGDLPAPQHKTLGCLRQVCSLESGAFWTNISLEEACSLHDLTQDEYSSNMSTAGGKQLWPGMVNLPCAPLF